jgi:hypothetical protein
MERHRFQEGLADHSAPTVIRLLMMSRRSKKTLDFRYG